MATTFLLFQSPPPSPPCEEASPPPPPIRPSSIAYLVVAINMVMMYPHRSLLSLDAYNYTCVDDRYCVAHPLRPPPPPPPLFDGSNYPNPNPSASRSHRLSNSLLLAASLLSAAVLLALTFFAVIRRRRRRQLLSHSPRAAGTLDPAGNDDDDEGFDGGEEPLHHAWYVRTVGLDDATIASIPVPAPRGGGGGGDCSVCLGEFRDGELVRLLPKCAHPFHLSCIDTWLRAHVSCPLCRSLVVDPSAAADPPTPIAAAAESDPTQPDPNDEEASREEEEEEEEVVVEEIENRATIVDPESDCPNSPLPGSEPAPIDPVIGRSVSMDSPHVAVSVSPEPEESELNPQDDQIVIKEKEEKDLQANLSKAPATSAHLDIERSLSSSGRGFFFSRHGRARSSILPL